MNLMVDFPVKNKPVKSSIFFSVIIPYHTVTISNVSYLASFSNIGDLSLIHI